MRKILNSTLICLCLMAGACFAFHSPANLYDIVSATKAPDGFFITWPFIRYLIEPFYAFCFYAETLPRDFYRPAILSLLAWTILSVFVYCSLKQKTLAQTLSRLFYAIMILATIFLLTALVPLPGPKLHKPDAYVAVDFHSHTVYSHDGIASPSSNLRFHRLHGYDAFFISEHGNTDSFEKFPEDVKYKEVFPSIQLQVKGSKMSVLLLSGKKIDANSYKNKTLEEMVEKAHKEGHLVIVPHAWKWKDKESFKDMAKAGIDGFEISNCGYRNITKQQFDDIIKIAREKNLLTVASSDWHGWGYMIDTWTVFKAEPDENIMDIISKRPQMNILSYRYEQSSSVIRFLFEPFFIFYYYSKNASVASVMAFMIWVALFNFIMFHDASRRIVKKYAPLLIIFVIAFSSVFMLSSYIAAAESNKIMLGTVLPSLIAFCLLWFVAWIVNGKDI